MIAVVADVHASLGRMLEIEDLLPMGFGKGDYLLVAGDFSFVYECEGTIGFFKERDDLDFLATRPYTILFIDGNHENFHRLNKYPVEEWQGGRVHIIRPNILHLMRGEIFEIDGKTVFAMGGGYSHDRASRREGVSWWAEEMPSEEEYIRAVESLDRVNRRVDLVLTHTAPEKAVAMLRFFGDHHEQRLQSFLSYIYETVEFDTWCFGHFHIDRRNVLDKVHAVCAFPFIIK